MSKAVTVPVLKAFDYHGQSFEPGDSVEMSPIDAAVHGRTGHVSLTRRVVQDRQMIARTTGRRRRKTYQTTALTQDKA
jgi:hypothetical protein